MANRLVEGGQDVTVWNRTPAKAQFLVDKGAKLASTAAEVIQKCDITFACVTTPEVAENLVLGPGGVLEGMSEGKGYVDMSTVDSETSAKIAAAVKSKGGRFCEAPVSGSKVPAATGTLVILAAGDEALAKEAQACFDLMGKKTLFLGKVGQGARMKLVINMIMGISMTALSEGMAVAEAGGLDNAKLLDALSAGAVATPMFALKGPNVMKRKFDPHFPLKHMQKDMRLALAMGDELDTSMPTAAACNELFKKAKKKGYAEEDFCAVSKIIMDKE